MQTGSVRATLYKHGAEIHWPVTPGPTNPDKPTRGEIGDMTSRSRIRAGFALCNAEGAWIATTLLSWPADQKPDTGPEISKAFRRFESRVRRNFGDPRWGWIREFTLRGAPHFHVFWNELGEMGRRIKEMPTQTIRRKGVAVEIVRGWIDRWIVANWIESAGVSGDNVDAFHSGGITELLRRPDAAGRYVAKEAGKRAQKQLPEAYRGAGRWWGMSRSLKPVPLGQITVEAPETGHHFVWDSEWLTLAE